MSKKEQDTKSKVTQTTVDGIKVEIAERNGIKSTMPVKNTPTK